MPPLVVFALGVIGATVLARWCVKEVRRVNAELDEVRAKAAPHDRSSMTNALSEISSKESEAS